MAYNNAIPQATDRIKDSQLDILNNFIEIDNLISVDHATFNTGDDGKHNKLTIPQLATPAAPIGNDLQIYNAVVAGTSQLHFRRSAGAAIPFTQSNTSGTSGWTYLPSGIKMVWGRGTIASGSSTVDVNFAVAGFPGFTTANIGVVLTRVHNATSQNATQLESVLSNTQFRARRSTSNTGSANEFSWFAIGN